MRLLLCLYKSHTSQLGISKSQNGRVYNIERHLYNYFIASLELYKVWHRTFLFVCRAEYICC